MSGTSLDGIDIALLYSDGENMVDVGPSGTVPYTENQRHLLRQALTDAPKMTARQQRPGSLAEAERQLTQWHAEAVQAFCKVNSISISKIDVIGFHGQTVLHRPEAGLTVQLGNGQTLADSTGVDVVYDLRAADVSAGGQGAPLVPVYHRALAAKIGSGPQAFVNIGGVANLTWIGSNGELVAFDTGPGNALINDWCEIHGLGAMDKGGALARSGIADESRVQILLEHAYFTSHYPKSLDRNAFSVAAMQGLSPADGARTLAAFSAAAIALAIRQLRHPLERLIVCGGGRHNPVLLGELKKRLPELAVHVAENFGLAGDTMEAEAWAYLAVRSRRGLPITFPGTTGVVDARTGGVLAQPSRLVS